MSAPELPPPPVAPGWSPAPPSPPQGDGSLLDRPAWRQGRPGWALLNVAIGFGIAIGTFFVSVIIGMMGRTQEQMDNADAGPTVAGTLLVLGASVAGWFLFAYIGWSLGRRWVVLAVSVGGSCLVAALLFSVASR